MTPAELLEKYKAPADALTAEQGFFTNFLGVTTTAEWFPQGEALSGKVFPDLPLNSDGVFAASSEYIALLSAIDGTPSRDEFTTVELGAGWGPWVSASGVICRRLGFKRLNLVAVEADAKKHSWIKSHLANNHLDASSVNAKTFLGAAWHTDTTLNFPKEVSEVDYGGKVSETSYSVDYRGHPHETFEIPAYSLETILSGLERVDYLHIDVQGAEVEILSRCQKLLEERVRYMFVGTHSRLIDGQLTDMFHKWDWNILIAEPCQFTYNRAIPSLEGMTTADGDLFVSNPRLT